MDSNAGSRFPHLRGVRWRINLGILPCSPSASIEDLRRVAADSRRRYASLRRRLLIDPHQPKDGTRSPDLAKDNPLSQNPDSIWGRFFRNAELEKMLDQDLSRLYPEHGSYFQTPACQAILRRILLLWCLRHPEFGYRQGMHELLAPLLYVLHIDLEHLSQVQGQYKDYFNDEFDETSFPEREDESSQESSARVGSLDELDPDTRDIILLSDAYGAEGELGVILSERFMEHDVYCMFDNLMNGARGVVAMADFFSPSPPTGSSANVLPVIEASSALYHLLSLVDSSLHGHLVELGVEPQYFALRWLRVLFGREFALDDLLVIWDELFYSPNSSCVEDGTNYCFRILCSPRGAFISAMAVSMLLHVRSSLFATENATSCLQRLLNFPKNIVVKKLIEKARSLQALALDTNIPSSSTSWGSLDKNKPAHRRVYSLSSGSASSQAPLYPVPDGYWEEKWRVLQKEETPKKAKGSLVEKFGLSRTESAPSPVKSSSGKVDSRSSVRRRLLDDLSREIDYDVGKHFPEEGSKQSLPIDVDAGKHFLEGNKQSLPVDVDVRKLFPEESKQSLSVDIDVRKHFLDESKQSLPGDVDVGKNFREESTYHEETCLTGENSEFSTATSPHSVGNEDEIESEKSSITSNSFTVDVDVEINHVEVPCSNCSESLLLKGSESSSADKPVPGSDGAMKQERKPPSGKFQWLWKFGRGSGEGNMEKGGGGLNTHVPSDAGNISKDAGGSSHGCSSSGESGRAEVGDKKMMGTLKNLGQSMLDNIQVIESVFQQDRCPAGNLLGGKGHVAAVSALKELRKISNLLSEM